MIKSMLQNGATIYFFSVLTLYLIGGDLSGQSIEQTGIKNTQHSIDSPMGTTAFIGLKPMPTNIFLAEGDTSILMSTLYEVNTFMEWYIKYFPIPYGSYSAETSWLFGLTKFNAFSIRNGDLRDTTTQASSISFLSYFTTNRQYKVVLKSNLMLNQNKAMSVTDLIYSYYPLNYYGIGNDTKLSNERTLNRVFFHFETEYLFKTFNKWYVGPLMSYYNYYNVELDENSESYRNDSTFFTEGEGRQSGFGIKLLREGRDNRLNGKNGTFVEISYKVFDKSFGSEFNFNHFKADLRHYITLRKKLTIATQLQAEAKNGNIPVQSLSFLGGNYSMRGIYRGRYRDNVSADLQTELRFPVFWILGAAVFGGIGQVAPKYGDFQLDQFHYVYGAGIRLKVDSAHDVNMRFDIGRSKDQTVFIINFAEAF